MFRHEEYPSEEREDARARANDASRINLVGPNDDLKTELPPEPSLAAQEQALCRAVGWIAGHLDHRQWMTIKSAGKLIALHTDATIERIALAPDFYRSQGKFSFAPDWIARDWAQISAWLAAQGAGGNGGSEPRSAARQRAAADARRILGFDEGGKQ